MNAEPTISVVIPTYGRLPLLREAILSVLSGTSLPCEIVVVDDGSPDDTASEIVREFGSRITCLTQPNCGPGVARNLGAQRARGDFLFFLDSDDLVLPWALAHVQDELARAPTVNFAYLSMFPWASGNSMPIVTQGRTETAGPLTVAQIIASGAFTGSGCLVIRRTEFVAVGGFWRQRFGWEDYDLLFRLPTGSLGAIFWSPHLLVRRVPESSLSADLSSALAGGALVVQNHISQIYSTDVAVATARQRHIADALNHYLGVAARSGAVRRFLQCAALITQLNGARATSLRGVSIIAASVIGRIRLVRRFRTWAARK